jgi:hypothetical protein
MTLITLAVVLPISPIREIQSTTTHFQRLVAELRFLALGDSRGIGYSNCDLNECFTREWHWRVSPLLWHSVADGFFHEFSGWVFYIAAFLLLFCVGWFLIASSR